MRVRVSTSHGSLELFGGNAMVLCNVEVAAREDKTIRSVDVRKHLVRAQGAGCRV